MAPIVVNEKTLKAAPEETGRHELEGISGALEVFDFLCSEYLVMSYQLGIKWKLMYRSSAFIMKNYAYLQSISSRGHGHHVTI